MLLVWSEKVGVVRVEDAGVVDSIVVVARLAACDVNVNICLIRLQRRKGSNWGESYSRL